MNQYSSFEQTVFLNNIFLVIYLTKNILTINQVWLFQIENTRIESSFLSKDFVMSIQAFIKTLVFFTKLKLIIFCSDWTFSQDEEINSVPLLLLRQRRSRQEV